MTRPGTPKGRFFTAMGALLIALAVGELSLWLFLPALDPYESSRTIRHYIRSEHSPNASLLTTPEPGLPGVRGINQWTTNNLGFRGADIATQKPENEYRIFLIGGSSTECLVLDDSDSIDAVVQSGLQRWLGDEMPVSVYNAGKSGDRSDDHIAMLSQRIVHLEPDLIVIHAGINDLRAAITGHDYLHPSAPGVAMWKLIVTRTQIGRFAYYAFRNRRFHLYARNQEPRETGYSTAVEAQRSLPETTLAPQPNLSAYENNLNTLAGIAHGHAIPMIFMTQQTTWNSDIDRTAGDWHWMLRVGDLRFSEKAMDAALRSMNEVMRQVAEKNDIAVYDLAEDIPKSLEYFYDDVHFNINGAAYAGRKLAAEIARHDLGPSKPVSD